MENEEPEVIRQHMDEKRTALSDKLEALENKASELMDNLTTPVTETVENVKQSFANVSDAVSDTVKSVKETFDVTRQFERHPWLLFGGAVAVGFVAGRMLSPRTIVSGVAAAGQAAGNAAASAASAAAPMAASAVGMAAPESKAGGVPKKRDEGPSIFGEAMDHLKGLAVGSLMGVLRDMASQSLPEGVGKGIAETVDDLTDKLGGKRMPVGDLYPQAGNGHDESRHGQDRPADAWKRQHAGAGG